MATDQNVHLSILQRSAVLQDLRIEQGADALIVSFLPDVRWACGFTGSNGLLVSVGESLHFVSDRRYEQQARREVHGATVHTPGYDLIGYLADEKLLDGAERIVFQADHVSVATREAWAARLPGHTWHGVSDLLTRHVAVKTEEEVAAMRRAQAITDEVFEYVLSVLRPGLTEREVAAEIVYQHLRRGAERMAFEAIVAGGPRSALPHARPTNHPLENNTLVVLDFGCVVEGYASDMTRTVALGEPGEEARRVYALVQQAQTRALETARAGLTTAALDKAARDVIEDGGYGEAFSHSLGHGIGLQTHEWPRLSQHTDDVLPAGVAVTIEPGIYLPDRFGVRIEDLVVLRDGGCDILTASPKDLMVL